MHNYYVYFKNIILVLTVEFLLHVAGRLSDSSIAVSWGPLTLEEARGLLLDTQSQQCL